MVSIDAGYKVDGDTQKVTMTWFRQPFLRHPAQICHHQDGRFGQRVGAQDAHSARLDQAGKGGRAAGDHLIAVAGKQGLIIRDKPRAHRHQLKGQRRLAAAGRAADQQAASVGGHAGGVKKGRV